MDEEKLSGRKLLAVRKHRACVCVCVSVCVCLCMEKGGGGATLTRTMARKKRVPLTRETVVSKDANSWLP